MELKNVKNQANYEKSSNAKRGSRQRGYNRFKKNNQTSHLRRQLSDSRRINPPINMFEFHVV